MDKPQAYVVGCSLNTGATTLCILCHRRVVYDIADRYPNVRHRNVHQLEEQLNSTRVLSTPLLPRTVYLLCASIALTDGMKCRRDHEEDRPWINHE